MAGIIVLHLNRDIQKQSLRGSGPPGSDFIKKENPIQVFSCEFCEIFKNTFFSLVAASRHTTRTGASKSQPSIKL